MPLLRNRILTAVVAVFLATAAYGETYQLSFSSVNAFKNTAKATSAPSDQDVVNVAPTGPNVSAVTYKLTYTKDGKSIDVDLKQDSTTHSFWTASIDKTLIDTGTELSLRSSTGKQIALPRDSDSSATTGSNDVLDTADLGAAQYWQGDLAAQNLAKLQDRFKGRRILVHLPSGNKAAGYPNSVPETDILIFAFIIPEDGQTHYYEVGLTQCPDRNPFPVKGNFPTGGAQDKTTKYAIVAIGQDNRCGSGTMQYKVHLAPNDAGTEQQLTIRPVYQAAVTIGYGFDTYQIQSFVVQSGKVARVSVRSGTSLLVGYTWFPWGYDADNMKLYNYFVNPFGLVDPKSPADNFVIGTAITVRGGLSVAIGASFHKMTVLNGIALGAPFTGTGAIPTRTVWQGHPGLYLGVAMDSNVFSTLKGLWSKANPSTK